MRKHGMSKIKLNSVHNGKSSLGNSHKIHEYLMTKLSKRLNHHLTKAAYIASLLSFLIYYGLIKKRSLIFIGNQMPLSIILRKKRLGEKKFVFEWEYLQMLRFLSPFLYGKKHKKNLLIIQIFMIGCGFL